MLNYFYSGNHGFFSFFFFFPAVLFSLGIFVGPDFFPSFSQFVPFELINVSPVSSISWAECRCFFGGALTETSRFGRCSARTRSGGMRERACDSQTTCHASINQSNQSINRSEIDVVLKIEQNRSRNRARVAFSSTMLFFTNPPRLPLQGCFLFPFFSETERDERNPVRYVILCKLWRISMQCF